MYKTKNTKYEKDYTELMNCIKSVNKDWISIRNSKEYKIGNTFSEIKQNAKRMKISEITKSIKRKVLGQKSAKIKNKGINNDVVESKNESNYFSNKKIAIYTSVFGGYDKLIEPLYFPDNCDFYAITDIEIDRNSVWKKINELPEMKNMTNVEKNRYVKINPHLIFKEYDYSIYVDGNIKIMTDLTEYIHRLNDIGIGTHKHHLRDCVYDELLAIIKAKKDTRENVEKHKKYLKETKMPRNYGLLQCSVIVREHNNPKCIKIMEEWWNEFKNYSKRDQISLPHVLYMNRINVDEISVLGNNVYSNPSFRIINHK